jgi:uncharacterized protein
MDLTLQKPGDHLYIRAISGRGICIDNEWHEGPLIISPRRLITDWAVTSMENISETDLAPVFDLAPDVVLIGTGARQVFLPAELMMAFYRRNIGVEAMATDAACRTFNVLALEKRHVAAALLPTSIHP